MTYIPELKGKEAEDFIRKADEGELKLDEILNG